MTRPNSMPPASTPLDRPATTQRVDWPLLAAAFALPAFLIMVWRWGGTVADSQAYYGSARYLRGEIPASDLVAPFPYRLLLPAVAALIPGELRNGFALLNWVLVTAAACLMSAALCVRVDGRAVWGCIPSWCRSQPVPD